MTLKRSCKILLLLPMIPMTAQAQESLEEVFVSATRVPENRLELNASAYKLDRSAVEFTQATHINEIAQRLPSLWISRGNGQESLVSLRSPVLTGAAGCGSVLMALNGVSLRAPGFCNVNQLFDAHLEFADSIEVLAGPTPASYGANGLHGMINILSNPIMSDQASMISMDVGRFDYSRINAKLAARALGEGDLTLGFTGISDGGFKDNAGYDQQKISASYQVDRGSRRHTTSFSATNLNQETAGYIQGDDVYKINSFKRDNPNPEAYRDAYAINVSHRIVEASDNGESRALTFFARHNDMAFLQHYLPWQAVEETGHSSIGIQAQWQKQIGDAQLNYGVETQYTTAYLTEDQPYPFSPNQPQGLHYDFHVDASTSAAFVLGRQELTSDITATAGIRLESTVYDYDNRLSDGSACAPTASACRFFRPSDSRERFSDLSAHAGILWRANDSNTLRLNVARGFRPPETAELYRLQNGQGKTDIDSESMNSIELGWRFQAEAWLIDTTLYSMRKEDVIFQDSNRFYVTGAKTRHQGLELQLKSRFKGPWNGDLALGYGKHEYGNNPDYLGVSSDINGLSIDTAPKIIASARLAYRQDHIRSELEVVYMDEYATEPTNGNIYEGHTLINLRSEYVLNQQWTASARLMNVADTDYAERADFGFGNERYFVGEPRALFLGLRYTP
jgi:iron complex outermembrane receptor protein